MQPKWREDAVKWLTFEEPLSKSLYTLVLRLSMIYQDQVSDLSGGSYERPGVQMGNYSKMPMSTRRGTSNATGKRHKDREIRTDRRPKVAVAWIHRMVDAKG